MASSLEFNKLIAGVLTAGIVASASGVIASILYRAQPLEQQAFRIGAPADAADAVDEDAPPAPSLAVLLAQADAAAGEAITRQCTACHVFAEGGDSRVGPYLWNVVGRDIASVAGFNYSAALQEIPGEWDFEALDGFLANPRGWAPGTTMSYAGLRDPQDRANLILHMRNLSHDPVPLPEPEAEDDVAAVAEPEAATEPVDVAEVSPVAEPDTGETDAVEPDTAETEAEPADAPQVAAEEPAAVAEADPEIPEVPQERVVEAPDAEAPPAAIIEEDVAEAQPVPEGAEMVEDMPAEDATNGAEPSAMVALVAAADPSAGERNFRQCAACHTVDQGGPNRVGPNLWDVFGADIGHHEGFNYSDALLSIEGIWTVDKLDAYLENPRAFAPGNRMAFAGLRSEQDRAAMIAYLRSLSDDPKPVDIQ